MWFTAQNHRNLIHSFSNIDVNQSILKDMNSLTLFLYVLVFDNIIGVQYSEYVIVKQL